MVGAVLEVIKMEFMIDGIDEKIGMVELAKKGKVELLRKENAFYVFFNGSPVNYWYDLDEAIANYNRICDLGL